MTLKENKGSSCSIKLNIKDKKIKEECNEAVPTDRFYFVHVLFILLGLLHFIPITFFVTANGYWMYKFRNVSSDITDTDARTSLQTHFSPGVTITSTVPVMVALLTSSLYGYKIKARIRVLVCLLVLTVCFILMTGFIEINTDSWQLGFFILTMVVLGILNGANSVLEVATLTILAKFPQYYMKVYLMGQGVAGIFNALLQIFTLAIGTSTTTSALIYFMVGSAVMGLTFILFFFSKFNKCYCWYISTVEEDLKREMIQFSEIKSLLRIIWPSIMTFTLLMLTLLPTHTAITSLVVSENHGNGDPWNDIYFVPVITFLFAEVTNLMGRTVCAKLNKTIPGIPLTIIMFLRMVIIVPLIYFCNAQPRKHSEVLFPHDWQYIIITGVANFTTGYFFNMVFLEIGKLVKPEKIEDAFMAFMLCVSVVSPILTPISLFAVELL